MAIPTGAAVEFFEGATALDDTSAAVSDGSFSVSGDLLTWTNSDNLKTASIVLVATFAVAPDANSSIECYAQLLDIDGSTGDQPEPTDNFQHSYVGSFPVKDITSQHPIGISISLPNMKSSQEYQFFIKNNSGQALSAGWDLRVNGTAIGEKA